MTEPWQPPRQEPPYDNQPSYDNQQYQNQQFQNQFHPLGPMPTNPSSHPSGTQKSEPPTDVVTAIQLWWAVAVLGVVLGGAMIAMMLGQKSSFIDEMMSNPAAADAGLTRSDIESVFPMAVVVSVIMILVFTALFLLVVRSMSRGKNWARMLLTFGGVFMVVSAIPVILGLGGGGDGATLLFGGAQILQAVAAVGAIVMMHRKESNPYFLRFPPQSR